MTVADMIAYRQEFPAPRPEIDDALAAVAEDQAKGKLRKGTMTKVEKVLLTTEEGNLTRILTSALTELQR